MANEFIEKQIQEALTVLEIVKAKREIARCEHDEALVKLEVYGRGIESLENQINKLKQQLNG